MILSGGVLCGRGGVGRRWSPALWSPVLRVLGRVVVSGGRSGVRRAGPAGVDEVVPGPVAWVVGVVVGGRCGRCGRRRRAAGTGAVWVPTAGRVVLGRRLGSGSRRAGRRRARRFRARSGCGRSRGRAGCAGRCLSGRGCGPRQRARCRCRTSRTGSVQPGPWVLVAKQVIRQPLWSVNRSCAPGWGRSRRAMIRIPAGHCWADRAGERVGWSGSASRR